MTIIAEKIVSGGDCIAKIDGKTVFVPQLLPGEHASIKIVESRKDYDRAQVLAITESSPHRRQPPCPYYGICGGCNLQIADDEYQRELRLSVLKDCFRRGLGRQFGSVPEIMGVIDGAQCVWGNSWHYRSRFQFHSGGLMKKAGDSIVAIDSCPIAVPAVNRLLEEKKLPAGGERVHVFEDCIASGKDDSNPSDYTVSIAGKKLTFDVHGFFQSNLEMTEKTVKLVTEHLEKHFASDRKPERLLDMYCGVGTFTRFAGSLFQETVLVEHNAHAIAYAQQNIADLPHSCHAMSGEKWTRTPDARKKYDAVIIDPPRSGMEKAVCQWLTESRPSVICSVSCDPVTHARDMAKLLQAGYRLEQLYLLDFYPQTSHIESLAFLSL